jgi:hypothetical protein
MEMYLKKNGRMIKDKENFFFERNGVFFHPV